jgi:hypothetical protein
MARIGDEEVMHAGDRLCAARALGVPFPAPDVMTEQLNAKARLLRAYDVAKPEHSWLRWMTHDHDPGDEDRSE